MVLGMLMQPSVLGTEGGKRASSKQTGKHMGK